MLSKLSIEELNEFLDDLFDRLKNEAKLYNSQSEFDIFLDRYQFQKMTIIKATSIMTMLKY
ncbi:hypothetical protein BU644_11705 [Staphylococcus chromogenes]|nr:hypothetical protein BUY11_11795 [Staphylococcus chromogenes]PTG81808.1 hypothetical protein BU644_11705 [Staphylococcus chromogenes]